MEQRNVSGRSDIAVVSTGSAGDAGTWRGVDVLDLMQEGVLVLGYDWRYLYVNRAATLYGRRSKQEMLNGTILELFPGIERTRMYAAMKRSMTERKPQIVESEYTFTDGKTRWYELHIEPVPEGVLVLAVDITQRRELQAGLALTQKMDALGRLAGGIAHDFTTS